MLALSPKSTILLQNEVIKKQSPHSPSCSDLSMADTVVPLSEWVSRRKGGVTTPSSTSSAAAASDAPSVESNVFRAAAAAAFPSAALSPAASLPATAAAVVLVAAGESSPESEVWEGGRRAMAALANPLIKASREPEARDLWVDWKRKRRPA